jgi:hypothetical protein
LTYGHASGSCTRRKTASPTKIYRSDFAQRRLQALLALSDDPVRLFPSRRIGDAVIQDRMSYGIVADPG